MTDTAFIQPTGWGDKYIEEYRDKVAPLRKNFWNHYEEFWFKNRYGIFLSLIFLVLVFSSPFLPLPILQRFLLCVPGVLVLGTSPLTRELTATPPKWKKMSAVDFFTLFPPGRLEAGSKSKLVAGMIEEQMSLFRAKNPKLEFVIEYPDMVWEWLPKSIILWGCDDPQNAPGKLRAVLVVRNGMPFVCPS